jgi:deazaflavin-dependent oxidoreductase (nitroreductase family)
MTIEIPPSGTRGLNPRVVPLFRVFNGLNVWMYRRRGGAGGRAGLLLTTIGARSGKERTVALGKFSDAKGRWLVVASLAGAARHPAWFINLAKHPDKVWVEVGRDRFRCARSSCAARSELMPGGGSSQRHRATAHTSRRLIARSRSCD